MAKKVLITGSEGFVGKHFYKKLYELNYDITAIDIVNGDDAKDFFKTDKTKFDLVIHLAAIVGGRKVIDLQATRLFENFSLDAEMFQWALRNKPDQVVYYSSSACYPMELQTRGINRRLVESDIDLNNIKNPDPSIYGMSKLTGEVLAYYAQKQGLRVHIFRPFSGYSHTQSLDYPFPSFIQRAVNRDNPFVIWGDGEQVRDWIHIDDIVSATLQAVQEDVQGPVNLCSGTATSFNQFATALTETAGYDPEYKHMLEAPVGVQYRVGDPTKMNTFYIPKISLEMGIYMSLRKYKK